MNIDINQLKLQTAVLQNKTYQIISSGVGVVLLLTLIYFSKGAFDGIIFKLKVCFYSQLIAILIAQLAAYFSNNLSHIKNYAMGGFFVLFCTSFYLDNFFFGSVAGNFLRVFLIFSIIQVFFVYAAEYLNKHNSEI